MKFNFSSSADKKRRQLIDVLIYLCICGSIIYLIYLGTQKLNYNWQWYRMPPFFYRIIDGELILGPLIKGLLVTLNITLYSLPIALMTGLLIAMMRLSKSSSAYYLATAYLEVIRNTPLLVQMYLMYFVLSPIIGIERFWTGVLCLAIFESAFISEIIRSGILSVNKGQWDGAASIGLKPRQVYTKVILPQALPIMIPPLTNSLVNLVKNSAIVSTIAIFDLTTEGRNIIADTFMSFEVWFTIALIYLVIIISLTSLTNRLENRYRQKERAHQHQEV